MAMNKAEIKAFNSGYLIACTNAMNLHGNSVICANTLSQAGITQTQVDAMDLSKYDADALAKIREENPDPIEAN
jgi:regulator of RNase E activity RraB